ncbi:single-stranded-DNA-specific exonuclease RecJ [Patescibacteria group bacterium]|nr:single-stranded-DNA-specific exonuclease RecJ [Patescibacteria group bacterium]
MYKWNILGNYDPKKEISVSVLENRGVKDIKEFLHTPSLNNSFADFPAQFVKSLSKAKEIITKEMKSKTPVLIYGDYDSDGINATAILYNFFKYEKGYENTHYFIPNRFEHSYGLSKEAIDESLKIFKKDEKVLFITVDVGITADEEISYIKDLGHSIILTDHHQKPENTPKADCLVWSDKVCGSVVSWVLSKFLGSKSKESIVNAAVATVTDLIPLKGFNRVVVKKGLEVINSEPPVWVIKLLEASGVEKNREITAYELGWAIGPRLNASGRLQSSEDSIRLLTQNDDKLLEKLAENLNSKNIERQEKTLEMYDMASGVDEKNLPKIIFSSDKKYHEGVIGLVSAKLTQRYYRPSVVISLDGGYGKGSVRSIPGINIIEVLRKFEDLFVDLGGHPMAGGFTIEEKNIPEMEKKVSRYIEKEFDEDVFVPVLNIDLKIPSEIINIKILDEIDKLKPFGMGNDQPILLSEGLGVVSCDIIGKDKTHLKLKLFDGDRYQKAVFFGGARFEKEFITGEKMDIVYTLNKNEYNGNTYVDLIVKDFRKV